MTTVAAKRHRILNDPPWLTKLFSSTEYAWVWLIARIYLGIQWLTAGWDKVKSPAWMSTGSALTGFWTKAIVVPTTGNPVIAYDWYRRFLQFLLVHHTAVWFGPLVAVGEMAVGVALLLGLFTGIAAFFGTVMNWNYMLAGADSINPVLGLLGIGVLAAWKIAGWWGADRVVLPMVGAPWERGPLLGGGTAVVPGEENETRRQGILHWVEIVIGAAIVAVSLAYFSGWAQVGLGLLGALVLAASGHGLLASFGAPRPSAPGARQARAR